jgi:4-methyl-5(b-hydroxyethyl)-thiazole monophosphate biosynthesis
MGGFFMGKIYLFLAEGFEEIEALTVVDVLRRAQVDIVTVSISGDLMVTGAHNISVKADSLFEDIDCEHCDGIILPGGMPGTRNLAQHEGLKQLILALNSKKTLIAAICAAPSILGAYGILEGKTACCFTGFEDKLIGAKVVYEPVAVDGHIVTSRGAGTAMTFALQLVEILKGKQQSESLRISMIV